MIRSAHVDKAGILTAYVEQGGLVYRVGADELVLTKAGGYRYPAELGGRRGPRNGGGVYAGISGGGTGDGR